MTQTVEAVYDGAVLRPEKALALEPNTRVRLTVEVLPPAAAPMSEGLAKVYEILGRRHSSGHTDTAERHNEHQP